MPFWRFRRRGREKPISEAEAYARSYGDRSQLVRAVKLEPRRSRWRARITGEDLRRRFEERLDARRHEEER